MQFKNKILKNRSFLLVVTAIAALMVVLATFFYNASLSQPGDTFYSTKVNVAEKFLSMLHLSQKSKAEFQVTLLHTRLEEVKQLGTEETIETKALEAIGKQLVTHNEQFSKRIGSSIDSAFPKTEVLHSVNEFATVAMAIENIAENNPAFGTFGDIAEDVRQDAVLLYKEKANSFVATENQNDVYMYIGKRLLEVTGALETTTLNADSSESVELYLDRVEPAIAEKDFGKVLIAIAEAERFIGVVPLGGEDILDAILYPDQATTTPAIIKATTSTATTSF